MTTQCIVGSPEGKIYSIMFRIYYISLPNSNCCVLGVLKNDAEQQRDRNEKICTIHLQSQVTSTLRKPLKKSYQFLKYAHAYLGKGRYARALCTARS